MLVIELLFNNAHVLLLLAPSVHNAEEIPQQIVREFVIIVSQRINTDKVMVFDPYYLIDLL